MLKLEKYYWNISNRLLLLDYRYVSIRIINKSYLYISNRTLSKIKNIFQNNLEK